jgi:creatinine amidohydrolase/Fe(II)-dependent formamide hydrolase-like protein
MTQRLLVAVLFSVAMLPIAHAQISKGQGVEGMNVDKVVELELLTQTELADKISNGWTSVLLATGGTEIRGPHATIGVHNVLATHRAVEAARRLGKTIVAPTIPFAVSATGGPNANQWRAFADGTGVTAPNPGAMQVDAVTFKGILQGTVESLLYIGFKDVFLMGDHGGGQNEMRAVSEEMSAKFAARGIRVHYVGDFYQKTHDDIDMYMFEHALIAGHGGMMETAEMMHWEPSYINVHSADGKMPFDGARFEGAHARWLISKRGRTPRTRERQVWCQGA